MTDVDHYGDGAWYDAEYVHIGGDIPHYQAVARAVTGPILELACGTGRLTFPMLAVGATITGVDLAAPMIARALERKKNLPAEMQARLTLLQGDMRTYRAGRTFDAVILGFNTLMHMTEDADLEGALRTARAHLEVGGLFHLDVHTPLFEYLERDPLGRYDPQEMVAPGGQRYIVTENNRYDHRAQINTVHFYYQPVDRDRKAAGEELRTTLRLRVIFPRELDHWLTSTGFELVEEWDDLEKSRPFTGRGGRRVIAARAVPPTQK